MSKISQPPASQISAAAHAALPHANPLSVRQVADLIDLIAQSKPATALDIGCGPGTLAMTLAKKCSAKILAIDISEPFLERARLATAGLKMPGTVRFENAKPSDLPAQTFDAILCVGSSQAIGTPQEALSWCRDRLSAGGWLLFADLTWRAQPDPRFIEFLGIAETLYWHEAHEADVFASAGLRILKMERTSPSDLKTYEEAIFAGRQKFAAQLDPESGAPILARAQAWKTAFDTYGMHCLGFTAYVATKT